MSVPLAPRRRTLQYSYQYQSSSCSGAAASAVRSVDVAIRLAALIGLIGACLVLSGTVWMAAASAAAGGVEGVQAIRDTVERLITRPRVAGAVAPTRVSSVESGGLLEEVWRVQSEPGALGVVPVLCVQEATRAAAASVELPVVFVLHGTGGSKEQMLPFLRKYAHLGYLACSIDSRYHGERGSRADYTAALLAAFDANAAEEENAQHPFM